MLVSTLAKSEYLSISFGTVKNQIGQIERKNTKFLPPFFLHLKMKNV